MWKLEKLDIGEETKVEFYVEVNKLSGTEETEYMINNVSVNADDLEKEIFAEEYKNTVKSQNIKVENTAKIGSSELGVSQAKTVTHIVEAVQTKGSVPIETEARKYSISGKVWYDKNRNGIRNENDENKYQVTEYKIKVTNEGNVAGYAKNIVDYMPKGMQFISELNPSWYIAQNGNI